MKTFLKLSVVGLACLGSTNIVTASNYVERDLNDEKSGNTHVVIRMEQPGTPTSEVNPSQPSSSAYSTATSTVIPMEEPVVKENSIKSYVEKKSRNGKMYYLFQTEIDKDANTPADKNGNYKGKSVPHWKNYLKKGERVTFNDVKWDEKVKEEYFTTDISDWGHNDFANAYAGRNVDKGRLNSATVGHLIATKQTDELMAGALKNLSNDLQKLTRAQGNNTQNQ